MKNKKIDYNKVYYYIREYYLNNFPYPVRVSFTEIAQILVNSHGINGEVIRLSPNSNSQKLNIKTPTPRVDDSPYENRNLRADMEEYLTSEVGMRSVIEDIVQLHQWLRENGFISEGGVATEKMLSQPKI